MIGTISLGSHFSTVTRFSVVPQSMYALLRCVVNALTFAAVNTINAIIAMHKMLLMVFFMVYLRLLFIRPCFQIHLNARK